MTVLKTLKPQSGFSIIKRFNAPEKGRDPKESKAFSNSLNALCLETIIQYLS